MLCKVTKKHIDAGIVRNCELCPLALALKEATGLVYEVNADFLYEQEEGAPFYDISQELQDWITVFDVTGTAEPITVKLDLKEGTCYLV